MLYVKPIGDITYQDILDFCALGTKENINLDYKEEVEASLAKTIAAMANTWGGLIIIGVKDADSAPQLPVEGIPFRAHVLEQINNIILGNITPPVFPEVQVCKSDDGTRILAVIRVPQSNMTPHAIRRNTRVYLRTNTSNEPEELATVDRVLWLTDRRKKSQDLREGLYANAHKRYLIASGRKGRRIQGPEITLGIAPLYPFEALVDYRELREEWLTDVRENGYGTHMPLNLHRASFEPVRDGRHSLINNENGFISYEEFNKYGLLYHRESLARPWGDETEPKDLVYVFDPMHQLDLFLGAAAKWYAKLGYWGMTELRVTLDAIQDVKFRDLGARQGFSRRTTDGVSIDDKFEVVRELTNAELTNGRPDLVGDIISQLCWAVDLSHNTPDHVKGLLEDANRA